MNAKATIDWKNVKHPKAWEETMYALITWYDSGPDLLSYQLQTALRAQELFTIYEEAKEAWEMARDTDTVATLLLRGLITTFEEVADGRWSAGSVEWMS